MKTFEEICAYCAGIMDGEGTFEIIIQRPSPNNRRKYTFFCAKVIVVNTDIEILNFIQKHFSGTIRARKKIANRKQVYNWTIYSKKMDFFCKSIFTYLISKKKHCKIIIDYFKNVKYPRFNISDKERERRESLYTKLKFLNKRGHK